MNWKESMAPSSKQSQKELKEKTEDLSKVNKKKSLKSKEKKKEEPPPNNKFPL